MEYELDVEGLHILLEDAKHTASMRNGSRYVIKTTYAIEILERLLAIIQIAPLDQNVPQFATH